MKCEVCRGACCETLTLFIPTQTPDVMEWIRARSYPDGPSEHDRKFDCTCPNLKEGRCGIYDSRPKICADYPAGGVECLQAVIERRTGQQYNLIRDESDPEIHEIRQRIKQLKDTAKVLDV